MKLKYIALFLFPLTATAQIFLGYPEQDCVFAIPLCDSMIAQPISYAGRGVINDLEQTNTCLVNKENNSVWYKFEIATAGVLSFTISTVDSIYDYDFSLFNLTGQTCQDLLNGNIAEVRCNSSASLGETGIKTGYSNTSEGPGGLPFVAPLNVIAGEVYYLLIDNFSSGGGSGYSIDFTSSTTSFLSSNNNISINLTNFICQNDSFIRIDFSTPFQCTSFASDGSDFAITGPTVINIDSAHIIDCSEVSGLFRSVFLDYSGALLNGNSYQLIIKQGVDGNPLIGPCHYLVDTFSVNPVRKLFDVEANFIDSVAEHRIYIRDSSTNASSWLWKMNGNPFGYYTTTNFSVFRPNGTYTFCLTASNSCSQDSICKTIIVGGPCSAYFEVYADTIPHYYYAINYAWGVEPISYLWSWGDGTFSSDPFPTHVYNVADVYTISLSITDANGCQDMISTTRRIQKTGDEAFTINVIPPFNAAVSKPLESDRTLSVFPNPASDKIIIRVKGFEDNLKIELFNLLGERIFFENLPITSEIIINTSSFESGVYLLRISSKSISQVEKLILRD